MLIEELLVNFRKVKNTKRAEKIIFEVPGNKDVYNITAPFKFNGLNIIAGRVEDRDSEYSKIYLFEQVGKKWQIIDGSVSLDMQDPFVTMINKTLIIGGVEVFFEEGGTLWRTVFYSLKKIGEVEKIFEGPIGMKDLRMKEINDNRILVLTRPQGAKGGRGKIGSFLINSLDELTIDAINDAPLLKDQFNDNEWGGANEIYCKDNKISVLGHIANFDTVGNRHYYSMIFDLDETFSKMINPRIIAERSDFLPGDSKREDLVDVVFSGGLEFVDNEIFLYAGISDAEAQKIELLNI